MLSSSAYLLGVVALFLMYTVTRMLVHVLIVFVALYESSEHSQNGMIQLSNFAHKSNFYS